MVSKTALLAASAVFALTAANGFAAPAKRAVSISIGQNYHPYLLPTQVKGAATLWDQNDDGEGYVDPSDYFDSGSLDEYDAEAADDFTVPKSQSWTVQEVDVTGVYLDQGAPSHSLQATTSPEKSPPKYSDGQTVTFYEDSKGVPGKTLATIQTNAKDDGFGDLAISLGKDAVTVKTGTYWVSVQAKMDYKKGQGYWGWGTRKKQEGNSAVWQNPGGGYGTKCKSWTKLKSCWSDGGVDFMFALKGTKKGK